VSTSSGTSSSTCLRWRRNRDDQLSCLQYLDNVVASSHFRRRGATEDNSEFSQSLDLALRREFTRPTTIQSLKHPFDTKLQQTIMPGYQCSSRQVHLGISRGSKIAGQGSTILYTASIPSSGSTKCAKIPRLRSRCRTQPLEPTQLLPAASPWFRDRRTVPQRVVISTTYLQRFLYCHFEYLAEVTL
jgi:hypothetical protein